jgi:hypothetical protein
VKRLLTKNQQEEEGVKQFHRSSLHKVKKLKNLKPELTPEELKLS